MTPSAHRKRVALLVETSLASGREILRGIARYAREVDHWQLSHAARGLHESMPRWMDDWQGDGIIARVQDDAMAVFLEQSAIPVVDVLGVIATRGFPLVHVDDHSVAQVVADHFSQRGYEHFAFYGIRGENWSERRRDGFRSSCADARTFNVLELGRDQEGSKDAWKALCTWLGGLPKPVAIMVCSDQWGLTLLEACREQGIPVPERIAVASVDNDVPLCEISTPTLTSVRGGHFRVGYQASQLLDELMSGGKPPTRAVLVSPTGIVARQSTDTVSIDDDAVAHALHHIREHLSSPLSNEQIAREVGISRTQFQRRFRATMGTTIRDYIVQTRLHRARMLIEGTDLPLKSIAKQCGFRHQEYLGQVIKKHDHVTPGELRAQARQREIG